MPSSAVEDASDRRTREGLPRSVWRLALETVAIAFRYRVTGLAAEVGFFALLSLPPLVLGLIASIGFFSPVLGEDAVSEARGQIITLARRALTRESVEAIIVPTLDDVLDGGRVDVLSIGFLLSLWSGSRALNVYVDAITIMYGLSGHRGIVRTRALSFSLYLAGLLLGVVALPLVLAGPTLVERLLPSRLDGLLALYWPLVLVLTMAFLATLYHVSVPVRVRWWRDVPGAVLAVVIWVGGSYVLRAVITFAVGGPSIYGPLAAPIVVLLWLYVLAIAVLLGAALNAASDIVWPRRETAEARSRPPEAQDTPMTPVRAAENGLASIVLDAGSPAKNRVTRSSPRL